MTSNNIAKIIRVRQSIVSSTVLFCSKKKQGHLNKDEIDDVDCGR